MKGNYYEEKINFCSYNEAFRDKEPAEDFNLSGLSALAKKYADTRLMVSGGGFDAALLAEAMFNLNYKSYVDLPAKKANVDNGEFTAMLKSVMELHESGALESPENWQDALMVQSFVYTPAMCNDGTMDYSNFFLFVNEEGGGVFDTIGPMPAINANSKNQALAGEFVNFLLSEEIQSSPENIFAAVNINADAEKARQTYVSVVADGYGVDGFDIEKNIELFNAMTERLTSVGCGDRFINSFAYEEFSRYFENSQTAEQTAANLQHRLTTYLNE